LGGRSYGAVINHASQETIMTDSLNQTPPEHVLPPSARRPSRRTVAIGAALIAALAVGTVGGAGASRLLHRWQPQSVMLLEPVSIDRMKPDSMVAVKGNVAEVFGNKFILQDTNGRALVDTGPRGEGAPVVDKGEAVTVQGRFDRGSIHAQVLVRANGTTQAFGPPAPKHGPHEGPGGPRADRAPPPPPPVR
jgi:hypothetical protein